ncbi:protein involved in polysaccharide export with SLBB domain [Rhizomicrobium palustre]|uniref:Protein involved in polysaccharide export with SLBB domain n=1 Tax=Rhizomicrobium palustre TaxID=189966 RepID=A0A846MTQ9_9PROT|nr:protein involved in polysaccharide export with SLBB domain [Rhizomicrobium palustre]
MAAVGCCVVAANAQSLPGISADQLQQLQQNRGNPVTNLQPGVYPQTTVIEPQMAPAPMQANREPPSRLEQIMSERAGMRLQLFGYDQLGIGRSVNIPQMGAMQDSYILGPGDEVVVTLRGQENNEYRATVDRDGQIVLPRLNPVSAAGRSLGQFRQDVVAAIQRAYVSTQGFVSIGRVRQISVLVSGEVRSPGVRTLTGLSTTVDAILVSGGVKKTGSLRNVKILRGSREITVDLYSVLTGQAHASTAALADGDRIVVSPLGKTVAIAGWVRKQGVYELPVGRGGIGVREFINLAGGTEVRGNYRMSVLRVGADGRGNMTQIENERSTLNDGDILFVQPAANESRSVATLSGNTPMAGQYAANGTKLSQVLKAPGALGTEPYTLFGAISHRDPVTKLRTLIPFTPVAVLNGVEDMTLQSDDIVRVFTAAEARRLFAVVKQYRLRRSAEQERAINPQSTLGGSSTEPAAQFGSLQNQTDQSGTGQRKNLRQPVDPSNPDARQQMPVPQSADGVDPRFNNSGMDMQTDASSAYGQQAYPQQNYSQQNYQQQNYQQQNYPQQSYPQTGDANQTFPQTQNLPGQSFAPAQDAENQLPGLNLVSVSKEMRRLNDLAKQLRVDDLVLINFLNDRAINVDGAVQGPGLYLIGPDADVQSVLLAAGGLARWADRTNIEILTTTVDPTAGRSSTERRVLSLADPAGSSFILAPRDELRVGEVFSNAGIGSVTVQGQVRRTGTFQIVRGERLSELLARAGGLTDSAYPYGTVFLRRSAALKEQESFRRQAAEIQTQLVMAMSRRDAGSKMAPDSFSSLQTYVEEVRNQKPLGRMTVIADPALLAANPTADPILEPNDVIYIPARPYSVAVLGEVLQPTSIPFRPDMSAKDYIDAAGGYSQFAEKSQTVLVLPDGTARRVESSWFNFSSETVPPGSTIYVARDLSGVDLHQSIVDIVSVVSQLAVTAASLAVLSKQ